MSASSAHAVPLTEVMAEDIRTAWVPDVAGDIDTEALLSTAPSVGTLGGAETLRVPRPSSPPLLATLLDASARGELHRAVETLRDRVDAQLAPGVCGYRRGAEQGFAYSLEHRRFQDLSDGAAADAGWVAFADVRAFFEHCTWDLVLNAVRRIAPATDLEPLARFAEAARASGVQSLPAGYADSRMLANAVLASVDTALDLPFVRWVDDYRIFAPTRHEAEQALARLEEALHGCGLVLNEAKVRFVPAAEFGGLRGMPLESVYHPDVEPAVQVRSALRSVFLRAVQESPVNRRQLRFVLPRMAAQGDDFALDFALRCADAMPWEAPRLAGYLAAFASRPRVGEAVEERLLAAATERPWQAARFAALASHTGIHSNVDAVASLAARADSRALWGLLLRALSLSGHRGVVAELTGSTMVLDPRAALVARRDVDLPGGAFEDLVAPATADALRECPAPRPVVDTLL